MPHTNPPDLLLIGPSKPLLAEGLEPAFTVHKLIEAKDREAFLAAIADRVQAFAVTYTNQKIDAAFMQRLPKLEIMASFGVGYDHIDALAAGKRGIIVTNTPDVLTEEVADTALGLLLCTVREFPQAERHLRAGKWPSKATYPLTPATLRNRTVGLVGMGRIGRRSRGGSKPSACRSSIIRGGRGPELPIGIIRALSTWRADVDTLIVIVPGGPETQNMIDARGAGRARPERHPDQHGARLGGRRGRR